MSDSPTLIVDTASLYFRAYYGVPTTRSDQQGKPSNAVAGLLDMLARLITHYRPDGLVCARDDDWRPAWRVGLVPTYKAHRVAEGSGDEDVEQVEDELAAQVPWIWRCLDAAGLVTCGVGGYEADDVLGTLAADLTAAGRQVVCVTGDRDLFQLVNDHVRVAYVARGVARHELVDDAWLLARYRVSGAQYADYATLRGDPSDGLPGVSGVGEKTAARLLARHGDLAGVIAAAADPGSAMPTRTRTAIGEAADYLARARQVVATAVVPLGEVDATLRPARADRVRCAELAEHLRVQGPMRRLLAALDAGAGAPTNP